MVSNKSYDVLIVGMGPVGVSASVLLGMSGLKVLIIEKHKEIIPYPRAVHLDSESIRFLHSLGLKEELNEIIKPMPGVRFVNRKLNTLLKIDPSKSFYDNGPAPANLFHQPSLEKLLRKRAAEFEHTEIKTGFRLDSLQQVGNHVNASLIEIHSGKPVTISANYIIGCDGARSTVRELLNIKLKSLRFNQQWLVVDMLIKKPFPVSDRVTQVLDTRRPSTSVPGVGNHHRREFMLLPGETSKEVEKEEFVKKLLSHYINPDDVEIIRKSVYTFSAGIAENWQSGSIFLAGDAAHQMPPFLGQGLCSGFRDVQNLCFKIAWVVKGEAPSAVLSTYQTERYPHALRFIRSTVFAGQLIQARNPLLGFLRDTLFNAFRVMPFLRPKSEEEMDYSLGNGLFIEPKTKVQRQAHGRLAFQGRLKLASGEIIYSDELVKGDFTVFSFNKNPKEVIQPELLPASKVNYVQLCFSEQDLTTSEKTNNVVRVFDIDGRFKNKFHQFKCDTIILRPDRYIFSTCSDR